MTAFCRSKFAKKQKQSCGTQCVSSVTGIKLKKMQHMGGFQLLDLIIPELKSHMTGYNSMPVIGLNYSIQPGEQIL